jgi:hypothetical protein
MPVQEAHLLPGTRYKKILCIMAGNMAYPIAALMRLVKGFREKR